MCYTTAKSSHHRLQIFYQGAETLPGQFLSCIILQVMQAASDLELHKFQTTNYDSHTLQSYQSEITLNITQDQMLKISRSGIFYDKNLLIELYLEDEYHSPEVYSK